MAVKKEYWAFCIAVKCEYLAPNIIDKICIVHLDPFDCMECMDETEAEMYQKYLEKKKSTSKP